MSESEFILSLRKKRRSALEAAKITLGVQGEPAVADTKTEPPNYCDQHAVLEAAKRKFNLMVALTESDGVKAWELIGGHIMKEIDTKQRNN